ncbi:PROTEIN UPSTREAM OF FLC-LIKE ISOFORM X1 [Salix purpurea]|uniref:PROTEIN UPSTREAM OF FLC-LIKE ISOFORM X1 n=1 Tax=Salix purpurea TaxID=77065 RepID=A0A9Q0ZAB6_SALPP|nr:PROTEIN UPSTREAM OF FLC-LIKE ISOFORM X1 [Salix purpurea]
MATNSTDRRELSMANKDQDRETSPDRTKMTILPKSKSDLKVAVVYYLTRNGHFEHPHFMEVPLSSPQGLQLKDVKDRLNHLRGQGMARMYSWSSKRSYKNGFVWQDLSESDYIHPCGGHEYILKGSLLLETSQSFRYDSTSSRTSKVFSDIISSSSEDSNSPAIRMKNRSWTTFDDLEEYRVYKAKITGEIAGEGTCNVSTQTDDSRRVRIDGARESGHKGPGAVVRSEEEASKLPLKSSSKAFESLERRSVEENGSSGGIKYERVEDDCPGGGMKPSVVLMKLVGCGSKRFSNNN